MGVRDWRARRGIKQPVRGEFRVSGSYYPHPGRTPMVTMLTGVVVAEGVEPTPSEHQDHLSIGWARRVLPALIDRADPTRSVILWDEVEPIDDQAQARHQAVLDAQQLRNPHPSTSSSTSSSSSTEHLDLTDGVVTDLADLPPWLHKAVAAALEGDADAGTVTVHYGDQPLLPTPSPGAHAEGRATRAVLVAVTDISVPAYALPSSTATLCDLTLQVARPDGSTYRAETRMGFRNAERRARLAVLGSSIPVHVDAADETVVSIDVAAWGAQTR